ncbi:hypothetical protein D3C81_1946790 [compost metagenome]
MQDHQYRCAAIGKTAHGLQGGVLVQGVEHRGRFVKQQRSPLLTRPKLSQYAGQMHPLPLSARQSQVTAPQQVPGIRSAQGRLNDLGVT